MGFKESLLDTIAYRIKANAFKGKLPLIATINWS